MAELTQDELKARAAERALAFVRPGMKLGLGTGSTARLFVAQLAGKVAAGLDVIGVPTSESTRRQAEAARLYQPLRRTDGAGFTRLVRQEAEALRRLWHERPWKD